MAIERAGSEDPSVRYVEYVGVFAKVAQLQFQAVLDAFNDAARSPNGGRPWGRRFEVALRNLARQLTAEC
jgi:hypothetical protein